MKQILLKMRLGGVILLIITTLFHTVLWGAEFERRDVTFDSHGLKCAGWYYVPKGLQPDEKRPAIVMAHGYAGIKEMYLDKFAEEFVDAGFVVLVFDYRYFGESEGKPRNQLFYFEQLQDYRNGITWVSLQKEVDPQRIGIWGTSLSGGHVIHLASFDRRVKAVVAQVPVPDLWEAYYQARDPESMAKRSAWLAQNRIDEYTKDTVNYFPVTAPEGEPSVLPQKESYEWITETAKLRAPNWENRVTIESLEVNPEYSPTKHIHLISPTPLLMIVASEDIVTPIKFQKEAFERAREPKKLVEVEARHFEAYNGPKFADFSKPAVEWFKKYLKP